MAEEKTGKQAADWDISEDFYRAEEGMEELRLEDFMSPEDDEPFHLNGDLEVERTAEEVRQVLKLAEEGKTIKEIAAALSLAEEHVYNIQICSQSFADNDPVSIAHMVLMG
ncbi:MAG: hypothetical protein Q4E86_05095 [Lachnospiraceae bacterium]|nr:hypothetical protein [Lachnospiraceae bacterium]MDO5551145.1 hypothetical protein [Lachnospiraceae bacterium]